VCRAASRYKLYAPLLRLRQAPQAEQRGVKPARFDDLPKCHRRIVDFGLAKRGKGFVLPVVAAWLRGFDLPHRDCDFSHSLVLYFDVQ
jgi:hypothetical protein